MCLVQTLAGNNIPETMIMSAIILRTSYRWLHVGGVLVIIAGTAVALLTANFMVALTNETGFRVHRRCFGSVAFAYPHHCRQHDSSMARHALCGAPRALCSAGRKVVRGTPPSPCALSSYPALLLLLPAGSKSPM